MSEELKQSILLVDDTPANLIALEATLEDLGVEILTATSGREALSILLKQDVSLVLLDVQMPEMDGFEVAKLMKGQKRTADIPIIFVTAIITDEQHILQGYSSGAIDYIVKPINPKVLANKVKVLLELDRNKQAVQKVLNDLAKQKAYFESILTAAADGVIGLNEKGRVRFANPSALRMLDYERDTLMGKSILDLISADMNYDDKYEDTQFYTAFSENKIVTIDDCRFQNKEHESFPVTLTCSPLPGESQGTVVVFQDVTIRKALEEKLVEQAKSDALTGLANRMMFIQTLRQALGRAERLGKSLAVLFIDLDQFKQINDTMGHDAGDMLIMNVAQRIVHAVRKNDTVARLGGDEFTVLLEDMKSNQDPTRVAENILTSLKKPFLLNDNEIIVGASIGIATYPECGDNAMALMQAADVAMYRMKAFGRNGFQYYTPEMNADAQKRLELEQELRQALGNDSIELYYQPQISIDNKKLVGVEALLRWQREGEGFIDPSVFITILEDTGLILPYGKWVLWMACLQARNWLKSGVLTKDARMCVNISARQFASPDFYETLTSVLEETELPPTSLEIEITESILVSSTETVQALLHKIKELGVSVSIDDFGTGYSSLSYLKQYPIDVLKIDRAFVSGCLTSERDKSLVKSISDMGHALGFKVLIEGVEDKEMLELLAKLGVDSYQGFYFSKPVPPAEFEALIKQKNVVKN